MINQIAIARAKARGITGYAAWAAVVDSASDERWEEMADEMRERDALAAELLAL